MKVLIVSLLRMGDFVMQKHVLQRWLSAYPQAEVHVLAHTEIKKLNFLFPEVKKTYYFDRTWIQGLLNQSGENLFRPVTEVQNLIQQINNENYDLVLNWTHQRISAYFMNLIQAKQKKGLISDGKNFHLSGNRHLYEFDQNFSDLKISKFHYVDYLSLIEGLSCQAHPGVPWSSQLKSDQKKVLVHPLSSDSKKNWSLKNWALFVEKYKLQNPEDQIKVIGALFEQNELRRYFQNEDLELGSLEETYQNLQSADWLISADTVTKHLAPWTGTRVIELALGSSQSTKTGVWSAGQFIIEPQANCYPCSHSQSCSQASHLCAERISSAQFSEIVQQLISQGVDSVIDNHAFENSHLKVYQTTFDQSGYWKSQLIQGGMNVSRSRELSFVSP